MQKPFALSRFITLFVISCSLFFIPGCQPDLENPGGGNPPPGGGVDDNVTVTGGVFGTVIDENNQPVQGATVTSGASSTTTDRYGVFRFRSISLSRNNAHIRVERQGYFTGHRTFVATQGRTHTVRIRLLPRNNTGSFTASAGGTVSLGTGGKLVIPANAVTDASGNAYTGSVNIAMTWIDPSAPNLPEILVGDLRGITTGGDERGLETFGMLGVEMTSPGGQPLKIATGKTAELTFPIPASLLSKAPATIDLWHFDETKGRWIQEGTATKTGSNYIGQVSHFSFWNCDAPFPLIDLCMTLVNASNNQPLNNVQVRIKRANGSYGVGWTDSTGNLCGKVPKDEPLTLEVLDQCNTVAWSQNIGPFSSNTSLGTISVTLPAANTLIITGTLTNCMNANVTNGAVIIYTGNVYSYSVPVTNGSFTFTLIRCSNSTQNFALTGIDISTLQQSPMYNGTGTSGTVNVGTIQACGNVTEHIEYMVDGVLYSWVDLGPPNTITVYDSTASNGYLYKTGIYGQWVVNNNVEATYFWFYHNGIPGTYPFSHEYVNVNNTAGNLLLNKFIDPNATINITAFGPPGTGFIEGNFNEAMGIGQVPSTIMNVICNFKAKR